MDECECSLKEIKDIESVKNIDLGRNVSVELKTGVKTLGEETVHYIGFPDSHTCTLYKSSEGKILLCEED
jgi:hypothetical protein